MIEMNELIGAAWPTLEGIGSQLAGVSPALLAAGLAVHALKLAARARAWQNVLRASMPERTVRYGDAAVPLLAGTGAGAVVPFGGGELLRVVLARTRLRDGERGASTATIVGSLAVERAFDVVVGAVVVALALTGGVLPNGALHGRLSGLAAVPAHPLAVGLVSGAVGLVALAGLKYRQRLAAAGDALLRGLLVLRQPRYFLTSVVTWQLLGWVFRFGALILFLEAFHVHSVLRVAPIVLSLQLLASSVPVTPAGAGTQQALIAAALGSGAIITFSAGAQLATTLVDLLLGAAALASCGIRLRLRAIRTAVAAA